MRLTSPFLLVLLGLIVLGFSACGEDDDTPNNPVIGTVTDIVADDPQFSTLAAALERTGLDLALDVPSSVLTVFAPTDDAFASAGIDLSSVSDEDLADILRYHVISGALIESDEIEDGRTEANTLNTEGAGGTSVPLIIDNDGSTIRLRDMANVVNADIIAVNGIIHVIDNVLMPPTLVDRAVLDGRFTTLLSALERVGLDEVLREDVDGGGDYTVFAPTDDAFAASGINLATVTDEALTSLLLYHVLGMGMTAGDIPGGQSFPTTLSTAGPDTTNLSLLVSKDGDAVTLNAEANVVVADVIGTNGVVHAIDDVLEMQDIVDFVVKAMETDSLEMLLADANLVDDLMMDGPYTVFAPVNAAFAAAMDTLATFSQDTVTNLLLYHVLIGSNVQSSMLMNDMEIATAGASSFSDTPFTVNIGEDADGNALPPVLISADSTEINFIMTDIQGTNGVIHLIDQVILPELE
jgi:transforming growth factor-beta-induced protein